MPWPFAIAMDSIPMTTVLYLTPQVATGFTFKLDEHNAVSTKVEYNNKDGEPYTIGFALGLSRGFLGAVGSVAVKLTRHAAVCDRITGWNLGMSGNCGSRL